jgi:MoxR-like ATPase
VTATEAKPGEAIDSRLSDGERFWRRLRDAVGVALVGGEDALHRLAVALLADGHALVEDVPGTGKTTARWRALRSRRGG